VNSSGPITRALISSFLWMASSFVSAYGFTGTIIQNSDDGTEMNKILWFESGLQSSLDVLGKDHLDRFDVGLRFHLEDLDQGEEIAFARLRLASFGGEWTSSARFLIEGVLQDSPSGFSQKERPSTKRPKTRNKIVWEISESWFEGDLEIPLWYSSPDLAPVLNEILSLPNWGSGPEGKTIVLTIGILDTNPEETNYVTFSDFNKGSAEKKSPAVIEIYKTTYDTFLGKEFLGRVTDRSVTVNLYSLVDTDVCIQYGTSPGVYPFQTTCYLRQPAEEPIEIILENLRPDTRYYYRLLYRRTNEGRFEAGGEGTFHTQRPRGASFAFSIHSDEHLQAMHKLPQNTKNMQLYTLTLGNIADGSPDFVLSLGDFAHTEFTIGRSVKNLQEAKERYLLQRSYLDPFDHSIPFYLVIGNHEGEQGWHYYDNPHKEKFNNLAFLSTAARKAIVPNPYPDGFYTGNEEWMPDFGYREDYYAWEWGDALFVVIDPFWTTRKKPTKYENAWYWTLGKTQYDWLHDTLHGSDAKWKFVFTHHLTSSTVQFTWPYTQPFYGRGGIEVAKYKVNNWPSFEWGGEDQKGNYIFDQKRPGWSHGAIHDMLVKEKVTILFHGHDHFFAKQDLDGIVYQECPQPGSAAYNFGFKNSSGYIYGDFLPNSGHVQVSVGPDEVKVEYIRAYLPGDGINGEIAYSYSIK
jgi:hypothetical protein